MKEPLQDDAKRRVLAGLSNLYEDCGKFEARTSSGRGKSKSRRNNGSTAKLAPGVTLEDLKATGWEVDFASDEEGESGELPAAEVEALLTKKVTEWAISKSSFAVDV